MNFEKEKVKEQFNSLEDYLVANSKQLVPASNVDKGWKQLKPMTVCLTFHDEHIKVNLDGVNAIYIDKAGNLNHSFIIPEKIINIKLEKIGDVWEKLEEEFAKLGYTVTSDDLFKTAVSKQLEKNY